MTFKPKIIVKIILLSVICAIVIPADVLMFALANSCTSCSTVGQYLASNSSLFQAFWLTLLASLTTFRQNPRSSN